MEMWRVRIACWVTRATDTHPECVINIVPPLQQWMKARASLLSYTYIVVIVAGIFAFTQAF